MATLAVPDGELQKLWSSDGWFPDSVRLGRHPWYSEREARSGKDRPKQQEDFEAFEREQDAALNAAE